MIADNESIEEKTDAFFTEVAQRRGPDRTVRQARSTFPDQQ